MSNSPGDLAIEVVDLKKHYNGRTAVDGLSLSVHKGEVFGLLGPNGAGKTTTVEILEGYRRADAGSVAVLGEDPSGNNAWLRSQVGVMLQDGGLYPGAKPLEILKLFAAFYDNPRDPLELLDLVGLSDSSTTMVRRLSGGQAQRLSLAVALVGRPQVLFLDEPTGGMDPRARAITWQLVRDLADSGVAVLLTTHQMDEAEHLCDRVGIIDHGKIVAEGTPTDVTSAGGDGTIRFITAAPVDLAALSSALGLPPDAVWEERPGHYALPGPATPNLLADLTAWLRDEEITLAELRTVRATLEEVFLRLTEESRA